MRELLPNLAAPGLVSAIDTNQTALFSLLREWPEAEFHEDDEILWAITRIPFPLFNPILNARLTPERVDVIIEGAVARGRSRNVPLLWWVGPETRPSNLAASLEAHGFVHAGESPGMAVDLATLNESLPTPPNLRIERVDDPAAFAIWCDTAVAGFGMPDFVNAPMRDAFGRLEFGPREPLRHYVGLLDGKPVATSSLLLGSGVAGIYNVATLAEARRQGIGAAITLAPLRDARADGYRVGILHSSPEGLGVYTQLGFREYCKINQFVWTGEREVESP
jgi:ribosomal protein S18 acetylase RimI-like enzyme